MPTKNFPSDTNRLFKYDGLIISVLIKPKLLRIERNANFSECCHKTDALFGNNVITVLPGQIQQTNIVKAIKVTIFR